MSGLLSRALRSPSSSSLQQYASVQSLVSDLDAEAQQDELELSSGGDDSVHSVNGGNLIQGSDSQSHSVDDETLLFGFEESGAELNAVASAQTGHRAPVSPYAASKPPLAATSSVAIPRQQSMGGSAFCAAPVNMARSCPRPINMQPRRQPSFQGEGDDLAGFVPPHELVACSLMDTSNVTVAESLSRKGTAALRVRTGVLRRTGFYEGHTETLRGAQASSFKV
uniref:Uncharacterized protein n=1 Tax=Tetradesmus obliquus TaxID=3088 RepID=A0A383VI62_TETOB|eukprot:jgi/Sobl393_1/17790/SZX64066.1